MGGHFRVEFDPARRAGRLFTWIYGCVQHIGLCYGDSAYFVRRDHYECVDGFRSLPLFEDLDLRWRLCKGSIRAATCVTTSSRRVEWRSAPLSFVPWILLQLLYWLGISPDRLTRFYAAIRSAP